MSDVFNEVMNELGWDSVIEKENTFTLLPEGEYDFTVTKMERSRHNGSEKLPPCPKAILTLEVTGKNNETAIITHNLFLHGKCEGQLSAFFICIGQKKHNEPLKPNWNTVIGSKGRAKVGIRTWKGNDGNDKQSNEIKRFLEPSAAPKWQPGQF